MGPMAGRRRRRGAVEAAVARDLRALPAALRRSGLAAAALELARRLDRPGHAPCEVCGCEGIEATSDRDAAALERELRATLAALPRPAATAKDRVDEVAEKRAERRRGG